MTRPQRVGVAGAGEQRGRADEHLVVGPAREVDAEEGEARVGHGVDERPDEVAALRAQAQPGAAERDDARVGLAAGGDREPVRPRAGAEDGEARARLAGRVAQPDAAGAAARPPRPGSP